MPVVDQVAQDYADRVAFVAPAWKSSFEATQDRAKQLMPSGLIRWGLDEDEDVFQAFAVPYQPVTVLITSGGVVVDSWPGLRAEEEIRAAVDRLLELSS